MLEESRDNRDRNSFRFYRQFFLFCFYFVLSLISFTLRPGPSQTAESANDTLARTNSSNMTTAETTIFRSLQSSDLSELVTSSFAAALATSLKSSLNVTQESLERIQLQVTSNVTAALRSMLLSTLNDNEGILTSPDDETVLRALWYTDSPRNASGYLADAYNESAVIDANATARTIADGNASPSDDWCVEILKYANIEILFSCNNVFNVNPLAVGRKKWLVGQKCF